MKAVVGEEALSSEDLVCLFVQCFLVFYYEELLDDELMWV